MSIGVANLFTRNFWKAYIDPGVTPAGEAKVAKIASLAVKAGALLVILFLPTQFALDLQLIGGVWILQIFPAVIFGLYTGWSYGLLAGWTAGFLCGSWLVWLNNFKPLHTLHYGSAVTADIDWTVLAVFIFFFGLVTVLGFAAAHWRRPKTLAHLDEWGLGGRQFGTWITWFLIGGDIYTAYTMIAVPALVYAAGAYGFFALPYTILVYPFVFAVMPLLWKVAKDNNYVTAADVVYGRYGCRPLELAVALTGVIATMPYIALQLIGMETISEGLGIKGELLRF